MRENDENAKQAARGRRAPWILRMAVLIALAFGAGSAWAADAKPGTQGAAAPTTLAQATPTDGAAATPSPVIQQEPTAPAPSGSRQIGAHVGVATPLVTVSKSTTTISDQFTVLNPIGLGFKLTPQLVIDFEFVISTPVHPMTGSTGIVVDPGLVYDFGPVAAGLRVAWAVQQNANIGLIPLVHLPLVKGDAATWFVEAAFPTFLRKVDATDTTDGKLAFNVVLHTGVGF
jgi:hypothetical protein